MYKVLRRFEDLQDNRHLYQPGDQFPRAGLKVSEDRLEELRTSKNRRHVPLIKFEEDPQSEVKSTKSVEPEVDEEIIEKIEEAAETSTEAPVEKAAEPEHVENATETSLKELEQAEVIESKPKRKRAKKEQ